MLSTTTKEKLIKKFGAENDIVVKEEEYLETSDTPEPLSNTRAKQNIPHLDNIKYSYPIASILKETSSATGNTISVCLYRINTGGMLPFVEYMMYRYPKTLDRIILFPTYSCANRSIKTALNDFKKKIIKDTSVSFSIQGCLRHDNMSFIFVQIPSTKTTTAVEDELSTQFIWATLSEIVNIRYIYGNPIHSSVTNLFCDNPSLTRLTTSNGDALENPVVLYDGARYEKIIYESVFGLAKATPYASLGPFYYLAPFEDALRYATKHPRGSPSYGEKISTGGVLRCVVFIGKLKVMLNKPRDVPSSYHDLVALKGSKDEKYIHSVRYMRDNAGEWASKYDSVIAGRVPLKKGKLYRKEPIVAIRAWNQQLAVSWIIIK
jgi:hypothetical protein